MFYKINAVGWWGGVMKVSKGPWFREHFVEDDGLDWFYQVVDADGKTCYLLTNNMSVKDRTNLSHLYQSM